MNNWYNNNLFMGMVNLASLFLQMQNAESFKLDEIRDHVDNRLEKKLDEILIRLSKIEDKIG